MEFFPHIFALAGTRFLQLLKIVVPSVKNIGLKMHFTSENSLNLHHNY